MIFALSLKPVGFYSATPFFIAAIIFLLGEKRIKWIISITLLIYSLLILLFMVVLNAPLPQGNVSPFYDFSAFARVLKGSNKHSFLEIFCLLNILLNADHSFGKVVFFSSKKVSDIFNKFFSNNF